MANTIEIYGFHGTTLESARKIMDEGFQHSREGYDWLGDGVYFWQDAPQRAWEWAKNISRRRHEQPAVMGVKLHFITGSKEGSTQYIDLLDIPWEKEIERTFLQLKTLYEQADQALPGQTTGAHRLDSAVINMLVKKFGAQEINIPAIRAAFQEGTPIFEQSSLYNRTHVQIAVLDESIIFEKWIERSRR